MRIILYAIPVQNPSEEELVDKSWAWRQGWLRWKRDPWNHENPHPRGSQRSNDFEEGWDAADFQARIEHGYFDWVSDESDSF